MKQTAIDLVKETLVRDKIVNNFWAIDHRITTRLADTILTLRQSGWNIETVKGKDMLHPKEGDERNCYYKLIEK